MTRPRPLSSGGVKKSNLKSGRPPLLSASIAPPTNLVGGFQDQQQHQSQSHSQSSKRTRSIIRAHHVLQKRLTRARAAADTAQIQALETQLAEAGGLKTYQLASTVGQSASRGGDTSRVLVEWLRHEIESRKQALRATTKKKATETSDSASSLATLSEQPQPSPLSHDGPHRPIRILEIGALSTQNALNIPGITSVRRIDLRSSGAGIEEYDFMEFPLPSAADGSGEWQGQRGYDVLSLSLVLNYVPDAKGRGDMLRRTAEFFSLCLTESVEGEENEDEDKVEACPLLPSLFLVLPAPCLHNSRYLTPGHLTTIMSSLGYTLMNSKTTQKLYYSLWHYDISKRDDWLNRGQPTRFRKLEINPGGGRNNFCIVVNL